ncbi:MAG: glycosyltransferase family 9 protein [bacterium]
MERFLICHRGALGDFILTWPAVHALREALTGIHCMGIGRPDLMGLAVTLGLVDSFVDAESSRMAGFFAGTCIPEELGTPLGGVLWLSEGKRTVECLQRPACLPVILIPPFPVEPMHVSLHHYRAVQACFPAVSIDMPCPCFPLGTEKRGYALIHPGSGSPRKNYPPVFYKEVARLVRRQGYSDVRFIVGPAEGENLVREFEGERIERPGSANALASLLGAASFYCGNDSGVSHLAGALGTPTIALYKTTDPKVWGVLGRRVRNLQADDADTALRMVCGLLEGANGDNPSEPFPGMEDPEKVA